MIEKIQNYIDDKNNKDFGNWQDQPDLIDPYKDNLGSKRIGMYLNTVLESYKKILQILMQFQKLTMNLKKNGIR